MYVYIYVYEYAWVYMCNCQLSKGLLIINRFLDFIVKTITVIQNTLQMLCCIYIHLKVSDSVNYVESSEYVFLLLVNE